jgi:serralysin
MPDISTPAPLLPAFSDPLASGALPVSPGMMPSQQYSEVGDAASNTGTSYTIGIGDLFDGRVSSSGDVDWVRVSLTAGQTYVFSVWGTGGSSAGLSDTFLVLNNASGGLVTNNYDIDGVNNQFSQITYTASTTGTFYLGVTGQSGQTGTYTLQTATNVYTLDQVVTQLTEFGWGINTPIAHDERSGDTMVADISLLTAAGKQLALWALDAWSVATGITFVTGTSAADIVFDDSQAGAFGGPSSYYPTTGQIVQSEVNISTSWLTSYGTTIGSYSFLTYLHEIGHALGLYHAGTYNGTGSFATDATFLNDSYQMTVMSYFDMVDNTYVNASDFLPITPMIGDIAAVEALYGPTTTAHSGNTTWCANSNVGGYLQTVFGYIFNGNLVNSSVFNSGNVCFTIQDSNGIDTIDLSTVTQGNRVDLGQEAVSDVKGLIGNMVIARGTVVENVLGGSGNDTLTGNSADNVMRGNNGVDRLLGLFGADDLMGDAGNDTLDGGDGDDTLVGGAGADSLTGGLGVDLLSYRDAASQVVVDMLSASVAGTYAAGDVFSGFENLEGGSAGDLLLGDDSGNTVLGGGGDDEIEGRLGDDTLSGGNGNDTLDGGAGADAFDGGAGVDTVSYAGSIGSLRIDLMFANINTNIAAGDTYLSIENLIGSQGSDNLRGTLGDNLIQGQESVDYIFGRQGNDTLEGGIGDDVLFGGPGADVLDGGANRDRAQYSESLTALVLDLMNPGLNTGEAAGDIYISIEDLAGSLYADTISGDLGDNRLFGREGADKLYGRAGNDYLNGGAHSDRLDGGAGDDTLRGGQNADTFVFDDGADLVEDFSFAQADMIAIDKTLLGGAVLTGAEIVSTYASVAGGHVVFDFGNGDVLTIQSLSGLSGLDNNVFSF